MRHVQKRSIDTHERILSAAKRLFDELGFEETSAEQIAADAGVAKGTVFAHFGDKANLLAAIGAEEMTDLLEATRQAAEAGSGASADLLSAVMALYDPWLEFFVSNPEFSRLFLNQSALRRGHWTDRFIDACASLEKHICRLIAAHRGAGADDPSAAFTTGGLQAFFFQIVIYSLPGWLPDHGAARQAFQDYAAVWLEVSDGRTGSRSRTQP